MARSLSNFFCLASDITVLYFNKVKCSKKGNLHLIRQALGKILFTLTGFWQYQNQYGIKNFMLGVDFPNMHII